MTENCSISPTTAGDKKCLLYYFFLAAFQVQQGFYQDLSITDKYPLNLIYSQPLLGLQDVVAPFWTFLRSEYQMLLTTGSTATWPHRRSGWFHLPGTPWPAKRSSSFSFTLLLNQKGIHKLTVEAKNLQVEAICTE